MDADVKRRRTRKAAAPQARTRRTRAAVVEAARTLFLDRGYAATTIEAISDLSDTPQPTVYRLFASKLGILKAVLDVSIAGDDQAIAMADRPQVRALDSDPDPNSTLAGFAALLRELMARTAPVHRILEDAARSDQAAAALLADIARQRQTVSAASPAHSPAPARYGPDCASARPPTRPRARLPRKPETSKR